MALLEASSSFRPDITTHVEKVYLKSLGMVAAELVHP